MEATWPKALSWVLQSEGGDDDDPDDPGGRTHDGITQGEYDAYCRIAGLPKGDVFKCPDKVRDDIYHRSYWLPYGPILPPGIDYVFFDECVNAGLHEAVLVLQRALGVHADGHIGTITSEALSHAKAIKVVEGMAQQRILVYRQSRGFWKYGKGWLNRVHFATANARTLAGA